MGTNDRTFHNGATFVTGEGGRAFLFDGTQRNHLSSLSVDVHLDSERLETAEASESRTAL